MCCTTDRAELSGTRILSMPLASGRHFIAYSNTAEDLSGRPNAMVLPVPGRTSPEMFVDTTAYAGFLREIDGKSDLRKDWMGMLARGSKGLYASLSESLGDSFCSFELGAYTVGLADSVEGAMAFVASLPEGKRPDVAESLVRFFAESYPGCSIVVCAFGANHKVDDQPLAFEYEPNDPDRVFFPCIDAHDGGPPRRDHVLADHVLLYEHTGPMDGPDSRGHEHKWAMRETKLDADVPEFLRGRRFRRVERRGWTPNGDVSVSAAKIAATHFAEEPVFEYGQFGALAVLQ